MSDDHATRRNAAQYEARRMEMLRKTYEQREAKLWAEVDALIDRTAQARTVTRHPQDFDAPVEWDGVDPGPARF